MDLTQHPLYPALPDLATVQGYELTTTRMISNPTMRLYMKGVGVYLIIKKIAKGELDTIDDSDPANIIITEHPAKELAALIVDSLAGSSTDDNDFNFIVGHPVGDGVIADTEKLRDELLTSHTAQIGALLNICKAHCNVVTQPFAEATQDDLDKVVLEQSPTTVESTHEGGAEYTVYKDQYKQPTSVIIDGLEALPFDDVITITCKSMEFGMSGYANNSKTRATIRIPANSTEIETSKLNTSDLFTQVKVFATSKYNRNFSVHTKYSGK